MRDAGFTHQDGAESAAGSSRRTDELIWNAAKVGTPPQGDMTLDLDGFERLTRLRPWDRRPLASLLSSLINAHIAAHRSCLGDPTFWTRALGAMRRVGTPYLLVGDSHSLCSCIVGGSMSRPTIPIHVLCTAGSAAGLNNPASRSGYRRELSSLADTLRRSDGPGGLPILLQFGQVDIEFVSVFHRAARSEFCFDRARFEAFCERTVKAYASFLAGPFSGLGALHVFAVFPPALADKAWAEGYTNAHVALLEGDRHAGDIAAAVRSIVIPTLAERTALHRRFNEHLGAMCRARHHCYIDLYDRFIGRDGTIAARFNRFSGGLDHHLCTAAARKVIRPAVERTVNAAHAPGRQPSAT